MDFRKLVKLRRELFTGKVVKEGFPIPSPEGEDEDKYISRCISEIIGEYPEEGQAYAICKAKWDGE